MIAAREAAEILDRDCCLDCDRLFPSAPALRESAAQNAANRRKVHLISMATSYVEAYETPPESSEPRLGTTAICGNK